jgi:tetratricopeptide (TPR) repeat protein
VVTIAVVFLAIARGVTGWGNSVGDFQFGFGFNPDDFPFEAASRLLDAPIEGNILNTTLAQGDAIAWKALAKHKAFVDSRRHLYPFSIFEELDAVRRDLKNDDIARWQPILDKFNISVVMIQLIGDKHDAAPFTYVKLMQSPNWVPFYDDGAVVMFGRADDKARPSDLAYFKANRLDAELLAYKQPSLVPSWQRTPIATSDFLDRIFQNRVLNRPQPHDDAAERWLRPISTQLGKPSMVTPANCLMAIREARTALSIKPDDTIAFQRLFEAYRILIAEESALIQGIPLTPENARRIDQSPPQTRLLANRMRQLVTVLNFRISTLPPPKTTEEFAERASLNFTLAQVYGQIGALDLARDRLQEVVKDATQSKMKLDFLKNVTNQIGELNEQLRKMEAQLEKDTLTYRLGPMDRAGFLRANGAPGQAIKELDEANSTGARLAGILPTLVDCYCDVGQPDKAFDVIYDLDPDSDKLSNAPGQASAVGTAAYRQGLVFLLLGSYDNVFSLWRDEAINKLQTQRSLQGPSAGQMLLIGEPVASTRMLLELPEKANTQAQWEFELGLATLEGGFPPDVAAEHFETALKLEPNLTVRPLIAYYLEKLGKPVPPPKIATPKPVEPATPPAQPDELPKDVFEPEPTKP